MQINWKSFYERLSVQDQINFARHLSIVIKAGLPLFQGLKIIRNQAESKLMRKIIDDVLSDINNGRFLADSLERYNHVFGDFFINIIRVGESSGTLSQNLIYLSEELKKSKSLKSKVRSAMIYPFIIMIATIGVTSFLTFYVFPKLLPVFKSLKVKLPPTTQALIAFVNFFRDWGVVTVIGLVFFIVILRVMFTRIRTLKYFFDILIVHTPVISQLVIHINMVNFTRVLGLLLKSGVKIVEAVTITSQTFQNLVYRKCLASITDEIKKGAQMAAYLSRHKNIFPPLLTGMIQVGEDTGNLEENLFYLAEYYEEEVDTKLRNVTNLMEPLMLLLMGVIVGFVALSIITPIYSISQGVR